VLESELARERMMQKVGAQYLMKKFADQVLAPPEASADASDPAAAPARPLGPPPESIIVRDANGELLGTGYRVEELAVYVVTDGQGDPAVELDRCIGDPQTRLFRDSEDGRLTAIIYVPDPSRRATMRGPAVRADDI
jgi:hypothetical protein